MLSNTTLQQPVVIFDGVCNLCSSVVQFVIKHDKKNTLMFASLQSNYGQQILKNNNLPADSFNSFLFLENGKLYTKSTGALRLAKHLKGAWPLLYGFIIVPTFIRDAVYAFVAKNRYKWFGKQEACWLPTPNLKAKFIA
jgi:predicted DCC family thiol-disulfide oxidoreductase YuxK